MGKRLVIDFDKGTLTEGVPTITATLSDASQTIAQFKGCLPAAPELADLYLRWQSLYAALTQQSMYTVPTSQSNRGITINDSGVTNVSQLDFEPLCQDVVHRLNQWLSNQDFATAIEAKVRAQLHPEDALDVVKVGGF